MSDKPEDNGKPQDEDCNMSTDGEAGNSLARMAADALASEPARPAIEFNKNWITYGELRPLADQIRELVKQTGASPHVRVALSPRNRPSAIVALMSLIADRRTISMVQAYQSGAAMARNLGRLKPSVFVAAREEFSDEVIERLRFDGAAGIVLDELGAEFMPGLERAATNTDQVGSNGPRLEMLTSGTTGPAKLWPLSYKLLEERYLIANAAYGKNAGFVDEVPQLVYYPISNISGLYSILPKMLGGDRIILHEKFSVSEWHDYVVRYRPTEIHLPPVGIKMILDQNIPPEDLASAKFLRSGTSPLDVNIQREFEERYNIPILLSYGATEFGGVVASMTPDLVREWGKEKLGSNGRAFGEAKLRVIDPESGDVLPPGTDGILEALVPSISPDWIRTSDLAMIDEDGFLYIRGRADGAIFRGGFKILPETIEKALELHPAVKAAAVVAIDDSRLGQVPGAVIELTEGIERSTIAELEAHLRDHLTAPHIPVSWLFVDEMPRTPSLKIARGRVKELMNREIGN